MSTPPPLPSLGNLVRISLALLGLTFLFDWFFWQNKPGASVGLFALILLAVLKGCYPAVRWDRSRLWMGGALFLTALQSANAWGFSNGLLLFVLLGALSADLASDGIPDRWTAWCEMAWALVKSPARWWWLARNWMMTRCLNPQDNQVSFWSLVAVFFPATVLTGFFILLFSEGNPVFMQELGGWIHTLERWLSAWSISVERGFFWLFWATLILVLLRPSLSKPARWQWFARLERRTEPDSVFLAKCRSALTLLALNGVFAFNNTLDVLYLWGSGRLPEGTTPSAYLHEGVHSLIFAVLASALVLGWIFHGSPKVTRPPLLRLLGLAWVLQNAVLIAGVLRRLALYVEQYQFTIARVYVSFFLLLVALGFLWLAWWIAQEKSFGWLLARNGQSVLALFFIVQFLDVEGWVAWKNVELWKKNPARELDLYHLTRLGPAAWPALRELDGTSLENKAQNAIRESRWSHEQQNTWGLSWQWKTARNWKHIP